MMFLFQSTGSVWSPTKAGSHSITQKIISIHGLRVEPDDRLDCFTNREGISIHGLRVEPDRGKVRQAKSLKTFQSTGSVWSPTEAEIEKTPEPVISIHGLRVEPDQQVFADKIRIVPFQSTGSVWSPTSGMPHSLRICLFQSTGSVWSPTTLTFATATVIKHFNPRAPCGARR